MWLKMIKRFKPCRSTRAIQIFYNPYQPKRTKDEWLELGGEDPSVLLNPVSIFEKLAANVLFVWGEKDSIVPAEESRQAIVAGLPDNDSYSILMVPDAGHQANVD